MISFRMRYTRDLWIPFDQTCRFPAQYVDTEMGSCCLGTHCPIEDLHGFPMVLQKSFLGHVCVYAARRAGQPVPFCHIGGDLQRMLDFPISPRFYNGLVDIIRFWLLLYDPPCGRGLRISTNPHSICQFPEERRTRAMDACICCEADRQGDFTVPDIVHHNSRAQAKSPWRPDTRAEHTGNSWIAGTQSGRPKIAS